MWTVCAVEKREGLMIGIAPFSYFMEDMEEKEAAMDDAIS